AVEASTAPATMVLTAVRVEIWTRPGVAGGSVRTSRCRSVTTTMLEGRWAMLGNGWHRLPCGAAVLVNEDDQPLRVCDLGTVTLDIDEGVFAGDGDFRDVLGDDLRDLGFEVFLDDWVLASAELRSALAAELDDDRLAERAAFAADVLRAEPSSSTDSPTRPVPGLREFGQPDVEVDRYGAFVVERDADGGSRELLLRESGGVLEVVLDGVTWCVDELVRRAWDDEPGELEPNELEPADEGRAWP